MENSLMQLDYRVYRLARLLSEHLDLGELVEVSTGSLGETEHSREEEEALLERFSAYLS
ncbi:MAG: hypothetical protein Q6L60_04805 [Thermostichus sp. HHBFW_bins_43]